MIDQIEASLVVERSYKADSKELWELWATKDGFESWWGPQGFRVDVHTIEARPDGALQYDMIAATPEMQAAMVKMGQPASTLCKGKFTEFRPEEHLTLTQMIDFLPDVPAHESRIDVDFIPAADGHVRMIVTMGQLYDAKTSGMQQQGFASQLTKLDKRFGWEG
ncbi:MAG: SRPBCC domain-containing protein [Sphingosinicella sp.]|nr:SRPBCC domain-containing protein [Sphingosinicella sp.]